MPSSRPLFEAISPARGRPALVLNRSRCLEGLEESAQYSIAVFGDEVKEGVGEAAQVFLVHVVQHGPDLPWHRLFIDALGDPAVEAEGRELAFKNRWRIEEDAGRLHAAAEHFHGFRVVVEVVGLSGGHRHCQGVTVAPPGAAGALNVVHGRRRHGAHDDAGEAADVHAEFQCRRRGKQVRIPRLAFVRGKTFLQLVALLPGHQRRVFGGNDAPDVGVAVQLA